jgi:hypothetical protein
MNQADDRTRADANAVIFQDNAVIPQDIGGILASARAAHLFQDDFRDDAQDDAHQIHRVIVRQWVPGYQAAHSLAPRHDEGAQVAIADRCRAELAADATRRGVRLGHTTMLLTDAFGPNEVIVAVVAVVAEVAEVAEMGESPAGDDMPSHHMPSHHGIGG